MKQSQETSSLDRLIGARAGFLRKKHGFSVDHVALICNQSVQLVLAIEEGRTRMSPKMIFDLCALYGINAHCFYTGIFDENGERADARIFMSILKDSV